MGEGLKYFPDKYMNPVRNLQEAKEGINYGKG
jgi:hypothetical protein